MNNLSVTNCPTCGQAVPDTGVRVDLDNNVLVYPGGHIQVSPTEAEILSVLVASMPSTAPFERVYAKVWGANPVSAPRNCVVIHVSNLKRRLQSTPLRIKNSWGIGYRMVLERVP